MGSAQVTQRRTIEVPDIQRTHSRSDEYDTDHRQQNETIREDQDQDDKKGNDYDDEQSEDKTQKLELTLEQMDDFQNDFIAGFKQLLKCVQKKDDLTNEDGEFTNDVKAVVMRLDQWYFDISKIKKVPFTVVNKWRWRVAAMVIETKTLDMMCEILKQTYPDSWLEEDGTMNDLLRLTMNAFGNFSDASTNFAVSVANYPGLCEKVKEILKDTKETNIKGTQSDSEQLIGYLSISLFHNLSMTESNIGRLREIDILPLLEEYLETPVEMIRLIAFATLAAIINEKESDIIRVNRDLVRFLLKVLSSGMTERLHRYLGWSCEECTFTIRMLARNDANKKLLVELGALDILVKLGTIGTEEEQYEAVSALWALCFDPENRKKICNEAELGVVDIFMKLKDSDVKKIGKICDGALWTLREDLKSSAVEKYKNSAVSTWKHRIELAKLAKQNKTDRHVMISYQWYDQKTLMKVRDSLKSTGVKVWMDIDQMGGSTIESMAIAVEQAKVVLVCTSQKYKNSPNCRAEAEYAYQTRRIIIPLKMERGYIPDGWLGLICGTKLFYDFGGKYSFDDKMKELLREVTKQFKEPDEQVRDDIAPTHAPTVMALRSGNGDEVDSSPKLRTVSMTTTGPPISSKTIKTIIQWTSEDVKKWIENNNLSQCGVGELTGEEIAMLVTMYERAPEYFFKYLQDMFKVNLLKMSKIVRALEGISEGV